MSLSTNRFHEQVSWLAQNARVVSVDKLLECNDPAGLQVALTFDDGYACTLRTVAPILQKEGMVATVYLNTACVGDLQPIASEETKGHYPGVDFLVWDEVLALRDRGWIIGSHGADHVDLTRLPEAEVHMQLRQSKAAIEERLGIVCSHFAYTWGRHNRRVRTAVAECGYSWAVAGVHGPVSAKSDRYAIPRIDIRTDYELDDFIAVVTGKWDYLGLKQRLARMLS